MGEADMTHATAGEEGAGALPRAVNKLIHNHKMPRCHRIAKRAAGAHGDDIRDPKPFESVNIGAIGHITGGMDMAAPMSRQKHHFDSVQLSCEQLIGSCA